MSSSNLPEDLANIVSDYTDLKTLEILNKIDPKIYTSDKLFVKKLDGIDRTAILSLSQMYKLAEDLIDKYNEDKEYRIDPLFVVCKVLRDHIDYNKNSVKDTDLIGCVENRCDEIELEITKDSFIIWSVLLAEVDLKIYPKFEKYKNGEKRIEQTYLSQILCLAYRNMMSNTKIYHTSGIYKSIKELCKFLHDIIN
jgi:hypothetical protein